MLILPPRTEPPRTKLDRVHWPQRGGYTTYRPCLRWEFGFTCAFCLLHEGDFEAHGVQGSGKTSIEHHWLQKDREDLIDSYTNCLYSCRFCNRARGQRPNVDADGHHLLEPTSTAWHLHFRYSGTKLVPVPGDPDAEYTCAAYDFNDPRKQTCRNDRQKAIRRAFDAINRTAAPRVRLLGLAQRLPLLEDRIAVLQAAADLEMARRHAIQDLRRYFPIPSDKDATCCCKVAVVLKLPTFLADQCVDLPVEST